MPKKTATYHNGGFDRLNKPRAQSSVARQLRLADAAAVEAAKSRRVEAEVARIASLERRLMALRDELKQTTRSGVELPPKLFKPLGRSRWLPPSVYSNRLGNDHPEMLESPWHSLESYGRWYLHSGRHEVFPAQRLDARLSGAKPVDGQHQFCGLDVKHGWLLVSVLFVLQRSGRDHESSPVALAVTCRPADLSSLLKLGEAMSNR
ncbi:MAG: hypothetical protein Q8P33_00055, partial [bacterium]|nr:hypothetical protein [bacterium]